MNLRYTTQQERTSGARRRAPFVVAIVAMLATMLALSGSAAWAQLLFNDDISYPTGNLVGQGGWAQTGTVVTNPVQVGAGSLSYAGYPSSGIGNLVGPLATSGQDVNNGFTGQTTGAVYASFLLNATSALGTGDYFFHYFDGAVTANAFRARTFIKPSGGGFNLGIQSSSNAGSQVYSPTVLSFGTTYLVVVKYAFVGGAANDVVSLFVDPVIGGAEPAPTVSTSTTTGETDAANIDFIGIRQGGATNSGVVQLDGFRVGATWADILPSAITWTITPSAGPNGTITPGTPQVVPNGGNQSFLIAGDPCYHVLDVQVDAVSQGAVSSYDFLNVTADHTISATFALDTHTLTATAGPNGSISDPGPTIVNCGDNKSYTITADPNYHIADVQVDAVSQGPVGSYSFLNVQADHTIDATFAIDTNPILSTAGTGGSIAPLGTTDVPLGGSQLYTITADACYHILDVQVDAVSQGPVGTYTFTNVTAAHTIDATFALDQHTLTALPPANGTISPPGVTVVNCFDNQSYTITPAGGYSILDVKVDNVSVGAVASYDFLNVQADHTIEATFASSVFNITASAGPNGSIAPQGTVPVLPGNDQTFTITPDPNYVILDVVVDAVSQGPVGSYTFLAVSADHTIDATFEPILYTLTVTDVGNGTTGIAPLQATYLAGTLVTLTPGPAAGWHFDVWSGDASGHVDPIVITMDGNKNVTATYLPNVYSWNQTGAASWPTPANWTPTRWSANTDDVLQFNNGATTTATDVPDESIAQLLVTGGTTVSLLSNASVKLALAGGTGDDFFVSGDSRLNLTSVVQPNRIAISIGASANGVVDGKIFATGIPQDPTQANVVATNHKICSLVAGGLHFRSGSLWDQGYGFSGNAFGIGTGLDTTGAPGSVIFEAGSVFQQSTGSNPFGGFAATTVTIFQAGSLARLLGPPPGYTNQITPSMSGRTYADYECAIVTTVSTSGGQPCQIDNLTVTSGTMNMAQTGSFNIRGNILVQPGAALNFSAASGTVTLSGTTGQTITVLGGLSSTAGEILEVKDPAHITLATDVKWTGSVQFTTGSIVTGPNTFWLAGTLSGVNGAGQLVGWFVGNLKRNLTGASGTVTKQFDIGDATNYTPVVVKMNGMIPGNAIFDLLANTSTPDHPSLATSTINPNKSVNRYYSLSSTNSPPFSNYDVTLNFKSTDRDPLTIPASFVIERYDGANWSSPTPGTVTATSTKANVAYDPLQPFGDFAIGQIGYPVNVTIVGTGTVTKVPDEPLYDPGTTVQLTATAPAHWTFVGWSGDATGSTNPLDVLVDAPKNITATFVADQTTLTTTVQGNGTIVQVPNQPTYDWGSTVQLTAVPAPGWAFVGWSGAVSGNANPANVVMNGDKSVKAYFSDVSGPQVTVIQPNGGELLLVGLPAFLNWTATDNDGIAQVDLYVSVDNGLTYTAIALNVPNTGSYIWTPPPPGTNIGAVPQFTAKLLVVAYDNAFNQGSDASDDPFAIFDLATQVVVTKLDAETVDDGVAVKWALSARNVFASIQVERADAETGPWTAVAAELREDGELMVATDHTALGGQSYWYRLVGTTSGGQKATYGPVQGVGGAPKEFALSSVWPNPSPGDMNLQFSVARAASVKLSVMDIQGRQVQMLAEGTYRPGRYQVKWDGRTDHGTAAPGLYFVRFITPDKTFTTRLVIAR